jgi:hypothetical protein
MALASALALSSACRGREREPKAADRVGSAATAPTEASAQGAGAAAGPRGETAPTEASAQGAGAAATSRGETAPVEASAQSAGAAAAHEGGVHEHAGHGHADEPLKGHDEQSEREDAELAAAAREVERVSTEHVVELARTSVRKMEELSKRAAEAAGNCRKLALALEAFRRDNAAFIAEMNGLEDQMTKLQRRIADEQFTAPMQKAMSALLGQLVSCKDDAAVAKAFLQLQR